MQRGGDVLVIGRLQVAEGKVLQFPFQLPNTQPIGKRRIDFAGLHGEFSLQRRIERFCRAHFLQLTGKAHHHQAHVADHGQQHLAQRLGLSRLEALLGLPIGRSSRIPPIGSSYAPNARHRRRTACRRRPHPSAWHREAAAAWPRSPHRHRHRECARCPRHPARRAPTAEASPGKSSARTAAKASSSRSLAVTRVETVVSM